MLLPIYIVNCDGCITARLASPSHGCFILLPEQTRLVPPEIQKKQLAYTHTRFVSHAWKQKFYPWGPSLSTMVHTKQPAEARKLLYGRSHAHERLCHRPFRSRDRKTHLLQVQLAQPWPTRQQKLEALTAPAGREKNPAQMRDTNLRRRASELVSISGEVVTAAGVHGSRET